MTSTPLSFSKYIFLSGIISISKDNKETCKGMEIDIIYTNSSVTPVGKLVAIQEHIPHIWHIRELAELHFSWKFILPRFISTFLIRNSDAVICVSNAVYNYYFAEKK